MRKLKKKCLTVFLKRRKFLVQERKIICNKWCIKMIVLKFCTFHLRLLDPKKSLIGVQCLFRLAFQSSRLSLSISLFFVLFIFNFNYRNLILLYADKFYFFFDWGTEHWLYFGFFISSSSCFHFGRGWIFFSRVINF